MDRRWINGNLETIPYDLEYWQAVALKDKKLNSILMPIFDLEESRLDYNDGLLLCLREPFYSDGGAHGESGRFAYRADGEIEVPSWTSNKSERLDPENPSDWTRAKAMHPIYVRYFMGPMLYSSDINTWDNISTDRIDSKDIGRILQSLGLDYFPGSQELPDKLHQWWKSRYQEDFSPEEVCLLSGHIARRDKR